MTRDVVTVAENAPFKTVAELLAVWEVSALPVLDDTEHVVGVVSEADLLPKVEFEGSTKAPSLLDRNRKAREKAAATTAGGAMSKPAVTIGPDTSVVEAARAMDRAQVKRLPVVDAEGHLAGIVSRRDLLSVFLRPDDAIRDEIVSDVFGHVLWTEPADVSVDVYEGIVTIAGELEQRGLVQIAVRLCRAVDGVVDVVNHVRYRIDERDIHVVSPLLGET
jgi:CBS domain-containing protein